MIKSPERGKEFPKVARPGRDQLERIAKKIGHHFATP